MQRTSTLLRYSLLGVLVLLSAFTPMMFAPGLNNPEAIGQYLNGAFPTKLTSSVELEEPFTSASMSNLLAITAEPSSTRMHFITRNGVFYWLSKDGNGSDQTTFMNISGRVWTGQDSGVLGMAFHPDFNKSGNPNRNYFYVYYVTEYGGDEYIRLSRFTRTDGTNVADESTELILIEQVLGPTLHRGGGLLFGNDGFLYLAIGDLGYMTQSQNITDRFAGGVFRIDVDMQGGSVSHPIVRTLADAGQGTSQNYYIPNDNPFVGQSGVFEEYYTLGCRNPHRMSLDAATGNIYIGNVGSNSGYILEEVNVVASGANFGWPYREGATDRTDLMTKPNPLIGTETDPIHIYDHTGGNTWICGGFIYRGTAFPEYSGFYIFADGNSRKIWAMDISGTPPFTNKTEIANAPGTFYGFGEDQDGEIYVGTNSPRKLVPGISGSGIIPDGDYYIRNRNSNKVLGAAGGGTGNGVNTEQQTATGATSQQWNVTHLGGGEFKVENINSGKVADVQGYGTTDGSNIHQWQYGAGDNQKWIVEHEETTFFRLVGVASGLDIEVAGSSSADGANIQIGDRETSGHFNQLWEFIPVGSTDGITPNVTIPATLSATGAFTDLSNLTPASGIIPYDMTTALWSDGSDKYRWLAVPNDGTHNTAAEDVVWSEEGEWDFPEGTVFIKHFELPTDETNPLAIRKLETRFSIHGENGYYMLSYRWRPDGSDADLLETSFQDNITINESGGGTRNQTWYYPSRSECFVCHTEASSRVLGPKTRFLNKDQFYPTSGQTGNQVETYNHIGMFDQTLNPGDIPGYLTAAAIDDGSASLEDRARGYLDVNCSSCHRPNGGTRANWNALLSEDLANANIINGDVIEDLGISGAKVIVEGDTAKSVLYQRLKQVNTGTAMPPLAKNVRHEEGVQLIGDWIMSMAAPKLSLKIFLEGPYNSGAGTMSDDLRSGSLLGTTDPYGLNTDAAANAFDATNDDAIVDWLKIELRDENDNTSIVAEKAVLLQKDGDIVDKDLNSEIVFDGVPSGSYFIVIKHYNHLGVMTSTAINLSSAPTIDFSNPTTPVFTSGGDAMNTVSGVRVMWSGDSDGSGGINAIDRNLYWIPENGGTYTYGTTTSDFNLSGTVNAIDINIFWRNNNSRVAQLP
ncbi:MAG: RICIN domain-containing protein [Bacteroidota bacterium]